MNHGVMACEDVEVKNIVQCSILKSPTHVKCHFGRQKSFLFVGHFTKLCSAKFLRFIVKVSPKTAYCKIRWLQFANRNNIRLQSWHSSRHFHISITLVVSTRQLRLGKHIYMWTWSSQIDRIGWRVIAKVDWNLKHWMHWYERHYAVFRWKVWIGLEFLTLGNQPKTEGLCLWSWMMNKCIM